MADLTTLRFELSQLQAKPRTAQVITAIYYKQKEITAEEAKLRNPPVYNIALPVGAAVESKQTESNTLVNSTNKLVSNSNNLAAKSNLLIAETNNLLQQDSNTPLPVIFKGTVNGTAYSLSYGFMQRVSLYILTNEAAGNNIINVTIEGNGKSISIVQKDLELSSGDIEKDSSNLIMDKNNRIKITTTDSLDYYIVLERF